MRKLFLMQAALAGVLALAGCALFESGEDIALSAVPPAVMDAAQGAVDGVRIVEAEVDSKDGRTVYELEGMANGSEYEIKVAANGDVLKVKKDD